MSETDKAKLTINYKNGDIKTYEFKRATESHNVAGLFTEMVKTGLLILDLEKRTICIPLQGIHSLEIEPSPKALPLWALRNVKELTS